MQYIAVGINCVARVVAYETSANGAADLIYGDCTARPVNIGLHSDALGVLKDWYGNER